ncbi:MAG: mannose-1-phosphate guanylyltransferase [Kiritimatiellae bacterium]|nr:mannose-1-phosphate guanylyltransferase [Kiritimatiellia bacterium]
MARNSTKFKAVILAGGSGERFWPLSTPENPKQFLDVFGGESLIRQSVARLKGLVAPEDVFVVTSAGLAAKTRRELPELPRENIVGEPMRRDTGAAVALSAGLCCEGVMGVFSSDQLVRDMKGFQKAVKSAVALAQREEKIVTLGIKPTGPSTAFGYVDPAKGRFVEKPDEKTARGYLRKGYLWNAGMFIGRVSTFRAAFSKFAPALAPLCTAPKVSRLKAVYEPLPRISFDYAVMEALSREGGVGVVPGDFGWDDVGGYGAFDRYYPHDANGNVADGRCAIVDGRDLICVSKGPRVAVMGVSGLVVVATKDAVLVTCKSRVGELKKLVAAAQ